jgi:predicted GTPase
MARETQTDRLNRIEEKIDKLSEAMIALARAEEKLVAIERNNHNNFDRMNRFSQKLDDIEKKVDDNARTVSIINKVVYLISVAVIGTIVNYFWM